MYTRKEDGAWILTAEDIDEKRLLEALSLTDEAIDELADEIDRLLAPKPA
jgi:hypothetical protein